MSDKRKTQTSASSSGDPLVDKLKREKAQLQEKLDGLAAIQQAVDGLIQIRTAEGWAPDTRTLSLFPDLPPNLPGDGGEASDPLDLAIVLADIVDKSEAICALLEGIELYGGTGDPDEREDMLAALGMNEYQWEIARGRK